MRNKKICRFTQNDIKYIDYKDADFLLKFVNEQLGKYNEHSFLSHKYIWDTADGNIILYRMSRMNEYSVNICFTSNLIREQMLRLTEET